MIGTLRDPLSVHNAINERAAAERKACAKHEAAHAVALSWCGRMPCGIEMIGGPGYLAQVNYGEGWPAGMSGDQVGLIALSGPYAERDCFQMERLAGKFVGNLGDRAEPSVIGTDREHYECAIEMLAVDGVSRRDAEIRLKAQALAFVHDPDARREITAVRDALLASKFGTLSKIEMFKLGLCQPDRSKSARLFESLRKPKPQALAPQSAGTRYPWASETIADVEQSLEDLRRSNRSRGAKALATPHNWRNRPAGRSVVEIQVRGEIGERPNTAADFAHAVRQAAGKTLRLIVNSRGGDIDDASSMIAVMDRHLHLVEVEIVTQAMSAAALIACAADRVRIRPDAEVMVHHPRFQLLTATAQKIRDAAEQLDRDAERLVSVYQRRIKVPVATLNSWLDQERSFTAREAVDVGLADEVITR